MIIYFVPILIGLTVVTLTGGVYYGMSRKRNTAERLRRVVEAGGKPEPTDVLTHSPLPIWLRPIMFLAWILPGQVYSRTLKLELTQAGYRHRDAVKVLVGTRVLCTVVFGLATLFITWQLKAAQTEIMLLTLSGCAFGFYLPIMIIRLVQNRRKKEITYALPDALDLLVICVEAGQGLNAALLKVGKEFEYKIYQDEPGGHSFNRLDTKAARESRREIYRFLAGYLSPPNPMR